MAQMRQQQSVYLSNTQDIHIPATEDTFTTSHRKSAVETDEPQYLGPDLHWNRMNGRGRLCSFYSLQHSVVNYYKRPLSLNRVEILHLIDLYCATHPYTVVIWAKNRVAVVLSSLSPPPMFILSLPVSQTE